ncbi:mRNA export protein, partial [Pelomyxa schiedti]
MFFAGAGTGAQSPYNVHGDAEFPNPPTDGVSALSWSPTANVVIATSWDKTARCYEITPPAPGATPYRATAAARLQTTSDAPLLTAAWCNDGIRAIIAGCNNKAMLWNLQSQQVTPIAQHEAPIKYAFWMTQHQICGTASWDRSVRFWDTRAQQPTFQMTLPERCYWGDHSHAEFFLLATADKKVLVFDTRNPATPMKTVESPLKFQTRCVCSFNFGGHAG